MEKNPKKLCTNLFGVSMFLLASTMFTSCGHSEEFTKGTAEDAIEETVICQDSSQVVILQTGYYEENDPNVRYALRQLSANKMITYKAEQINEYKEAGYWSPARTISHVFVSVALTPEGKKYIVTEPVKDKDADELKNTKKEKEYPESTVPVTENIPLLNPKAGAPAPVVEDETGVSSNSYDSSYSLPEGKELTPYQQAKAKVQSTSFNVLSHRCEVYDVKNLSCTEDDKKHGQATCDVIIEIKDVTPFGRILAGARNGDRKKYANIHFSYFIDKGWQVTEK